MCPVEASRGLISRSWHCCFQIFMRSSAYEGNVPLNRQLPANAHWLIWMWGEGNYAAISLNLKPRYVCGMIVQYGSLMAFYYTASIYDIILGYSTLLQLCFSSSRNRCSVQEYTGRVNADFTFRHKMKHLLNICEIFSI